MLLWKWIPIQITWIENEDILPMTNRINKAKIEQNQ